MFYYILSLYMFWWHDHVNEYELSVGDIHKTFAHILHI